jgi:hypothetical protein
MPTYVMLTGHRVVANTEAVMGLLRYIIVTLLARGHEVVGISGGATGADSMWAHALHLEGRPFKLFVPNRYYFPNYQPNDPDAQWMIDHCDGEPLYVVDRPIVPRSVWEPRMKARPGNDPWWVDNFDRNKAMVQAASKYIAVSNIHPRTVVEAKLKDIRAMKGGTNGGIFDIYRFGQAEDGLLKIAWINPTDPNGVTSVRFPKG